MSDERDWGERDWAECECGHYGDEHGPDGCEVRASSGYTCACPGFKAA